MDVTGGKIVPDRRRGMLRVVEEAGVRNIQWCDLETLNPIETYMAFPGDAKFEKVK